MKHIGHILGALVAACIVAAWGVIFMCYCRVKTGQWWIGEKR